MMSKEKETKEIFHEMFLKTKNALQRRDTSLITVLTQLYI
jgi:hypothetical protein